MRDTPIINMNSKIKIRGRSSARYVIFMPRKISRGKRAANSSEDPMRFARLLDRTRSHLGK